MPTTLNAAPLPTSGPLGKKENYEPTNKDLLENAWQQNAKINEISNDVADVKDTVSDLSSIVASHSAVVEKIETLKNLAIWAVTFLGMSGLAAILNWIKLWLHG